MLLKLKGGAMRICVFCSSSSAVGQAYVDAAAELGRLIGQRGHSLIYGGSTAGLMGVLCDSASAAGAPVHGVIPRRLVECGVGNMAVSRLTITETMAERKTLMEQEAEGFIALPGGFGTLEEVTEALTQKQLRYLDAPIVFVNTNGFYDALAAFFEQLYREHFAHAAYRDTYYLGSTPADALDYVERYVSTDMPLKWVGREMTGVQ